METMRETNDTNERITWYELVRRVGPLLQGEMMVWVVRVWEFGSHAWAWARGFGVEDW